MVGLPSSAGGKGGLEKGHYNLVRGLFGWTLRGKHLEPLCFGVHGATHVSEEERSTEKGSQNKKLSKRGPAKGSASCKTVEGRKGEALAQM